MVVTVISSFVFAAVLSAYVFLGRGLVREGNAESMEAGSRLAQYYLMRDVNTCVSVATASPSILTVNVGSNTTPIYVTYTYDSTGGTLIRTATTNPTNLTLMTGLLTFAFNYYGLGGMTIYPSPQGLLWIKQMNMVYTLVAGSAVSGAQARFAVVSPQVMMKNKGLLQ
jgi:hypothetical protein